MLLEIIGMFDGNGILLTAFAVITLGGALINNGYLSRILKGRGKGKTITELAKRMEEIEIGFVPSLDDILARIEGKIDGLSAHISDVERRLGHVDRTALMGVIYNDKIHKADRLRAFVIYLKQGENGLVEKYAEKELIASNRDEWLRALRECKMNVYGDKSEYDKRIAEINGRMG